MMYRLAIVLLLLGLLVLSPVIAGGVNRTDSDQDAAIDRLNCTVYGEDCATPEPHTPTPTSEPAPTATPEPTVTATPALTGWHAATDHEHGDAPPDWVQTWSMATFGYGVVYGGDEATPGEDHHKHQAYKGYAWNGVADDGQTVALYLRVHLASNPMDRGVRYHSYEMYARDATGAVSFWQGWLDFGAVPGARDTFADDYLWKIIPRYSPSNHVVGFAPGSNPYYVASYSGKEFWYAQASTPGGWEPIILIDIYDPTTTYAAGEELTAADMQTWQMTGQLGLERRVTLRWIAGGSQVMTASGQPYLTRNMADPRGWFCATPTGDITGSGSADCTAGSLPQYIAPTLPTIGKTTSPPGYRATWTCAGCRTPN